MDNKSQPEVNQVFRFWQENWEKTFRDLGFTKDLASDSFLNSDFATAIFLDEQIVSISLFKMFDTNHAGFTSHSYFQKWQEHSHLLTAHQKIFNCTYFCVAPEFRKQMFDDFSSKQLNLGMLLMAFANTQLDVMAATPRRDRNMHKLLYDWGGVCILEDVPSGYGDKIDLVIYEKKNVIHAMERKNMRLIFKLWDERTVIPFSTVDFDLMNLEKLTTKPFKKAG